MLIVFVKTDDPYFSKLAGNPEIWGLPKERVCRHGVCFIKGKTKIAIKQGQKKRA
jgi:hypothetical protein